MKAFCAETFCSFTVPASSITVIVTGSVCPVVMSNGGATAMICVAVTELTKASLAG